LADLGGIARVRVGGVDEAHAGVQRGMDDRDGRVGLRPRGRHRRPHRAQPDTDGGDWVSRLVFMFRGVP
jgi:hypothetical protein